MVCVCGRRLGVGHYIGWLVGPRGWLFCAPPCSSHLKGPPVGPVSWCHGVMVRTGVALLWEGACKSMLLVVALPLLFFTGDWLWRLVWTMMI